MKTIRITDAAHNVLKAVKVQVKDKREESCSLSDAILELGKRAGIAGVQ